MLPGKLWPFFRARFKALSTNEQRLTVILIAGLVWFCVTPQITEPIKETVGSRAANVGQSFSELLSSTTRDPSCDFTPSSDPLPVYEHADQIDFDNWPISRHRPANQFASATCYTKLPRQFKSRPVFTLITATQNTGPAFAQTVLAVRSQSLQNFRWLIIDDHSDDPESIKRLDAAALDQRVTILHNVDAPGLPNSRNTALKYLEAHPSEQPLYIGMIDDDDMQELTTVEKAIWMLESNPQWDFVSPYIVSFGDLNKTDERGAHLGTANFIAANWIADTAVMRYSASKHCRYDQTYKRGGEDWDFWMCLAKNGQWGGTLPELGFWYRIRQAASRRSRWGHTFDGKVTFGELRDKIHAKYPEFWKVENYWMSRPAALTALETLDWQPPINNALAETAPSGSVLFMMPWLHMGGADIGAIRMVETLSQKGYRVTVVCTLYDYPAGIELRPQMMQHTHDVHILPSFLRAVDFPRYIKYLADSRNVHTVLISNSMLAYEMLPALREQMPGVAFMDYLHNEAYDGWKSGGYPTYSILHQRYLDRSLACSHHLREWMIERGHTASRVGVVKLGVDLNRVLDTSETKKREARQALFKDTVDANSLIILTVARLDPQKRSDMIPDIVQQLVQNHGFACGNPSDQNKRKVLMVMVGDGPLKATVETKIDQLKLRACFHMAGTQLDPTKYYQAADMFLLPSKSEGISVSVSEAMAARLPVVAASAGALPEQIGGDEDPGRAGFVIKQQINIASEAVDYAQTVNRIANDRKLASKLGNNGAIKVKGADWHTTLLDLLPEISRARQVRKRPRNNKELQDLPHPAAYLALQTQLLEARRLVDFSIIYSTLSAEPRAGVGRDLQLVCGESDTMSPWIDSLELAQPCEKDESIDGRALRASALLQCGAWCIWDLRSSAKIGWNYDGTCYRQITDDICQEWFSQRPPTMLPSP